MEPSLCEMEEEFQKLQDVVRGTTFEVSWGRANGPYHMLQVCIWSNEINLSKWKEWVSIFFPAALSLGRSWIEPLELIEVANAYVEEDPEADEYAKAILDKDGNNEIRATAALMLIRSLLNQGKRSDALALSTSIPEMGCQHIRAVVDRLLE